jgi:hypothetical protein
MMWNLMAAGFVLTRLAIVAKGAVVVDIVVVVVVVGMVVVVVAAPGAVVVGIKGSHPIPYRSFYN